VSPDYTGTCDAETHEVTVCANEPIELTLPDEGSSLREVEGLPSSAKLEGRTIKGKFSRKTTLAFGGPEETRQYWRVNTTGNCPTLATEFSDPLCLGDDVDRNIQGAGGNGLLSYELVTKNTEFVLTEDGRLTGIASETGSRQLDIAITDERGIRKTSSLAFSVTDECADVKGELPNGCAGSDYEANLTLIGQAPIDVTDFTPTHKDGKGLSSAEAKRWQSELNAKVSRRDDGYVLEASPSSNAQGSYLFSVKLQNALSIEPRDVPFAVASCAAVKADFTVCEDESFDVDLAGSPGDVWTFYEQPEPLAEQLQFVSDRRLRGSLSASATAYSVRAQVVNEAANTNRLETLTLAVLEAASPACKPDLTEAGTDAGETSSITSTGDAGAPPTPPGPPGMATGCVGEPYEFAVPANGIAHGSWSAQLPDGLSIDDDGIVRGVPEQPFDGSIQVGGLRDFNIVSSAYHLTVHGWCSVVFKGTEGASTTTRLYLADRRETVPTIEVSAELDSSYEVTAFAISPSRSHVAFAAESSNTGASVVLIRRTIALPTGVADEYFVGPIRTAPFDGTITEINWDNDDHVAFLLDEHGLDGGSGRKVFVFDVDKAGQTQGPTQVLENSVPEGRDLVWAGDYPCVAFADLPLSNDYGTLCFDLSTGMAAEGTPISIGLDQYQVRSLDGRLLQVQPRGAGLPVLTSWVPFANSGNEAVLHAATFASPRGDFVGTVRQSDMEIARASDSTIHNPDLGHMVYTPMGRVPNCTSVDTWHNGWFACSLGDEDPTETLTFGRPNVADVTTLTPISAPGHTLSGQRTFVGDGFYAFDDQLGNLNYVDLTTTPPTLGQFALPDGSYAVSLAAIADDRLVFQGQDALWVVSLSHGNPINVARVVDAPEPAAAVDLCETAFGWTGFENWCGGDEAPRRFQVAPDGDLGVYQTADGELALFSADSERLLKTVDGIRVPCGDHPYCLTAFTITR
jgi:hypothetical protein